MIKYHLAIDIGASSGRHILGYIENEQIVLIEIFRFENGIKPENDSLTWDINYLTEKVIEGIAKCKTLDIIPETVAIDTWGVDYVLLDKNKNPLLPVMAYRDTRTDDVIKSVQSIVSKEELYSKTGIQMQNFNTIYQLYCDKLSGKMDNAEHFVMIPDYLSFKLTGVLKNEYTNATTTNLVNAQSKSWDMDIIKKLGFKESLFCELYTPSTLVGAFSKDIESRVGFSSNVILCPTHDTASAVAACPIDDESIYLSSGTWSLIGAESLTPILSNQAMNSNFTNEGGIEYRFRFLKNITGMWIFQNIKKELNNKYSYPEITSLAMQSSFCEKIDTNAKEFVNPKSMIQAIKDYLGKPDLPLCDILNCAYHSLAFSYAETIKEIESITGKSYKNINIVGGGSNVKYLNELTAQYTDKKVFAGPTEATAMGNIISQMMYSDSNFSLQNARNLIKSSMDVTEVM